MPLIEDYALLGDLHTAALVSREGGVDWLCLPRFDSPACFAALLADEHAGTWQLAPRAGGPATRRAYRGDSLILDSEWDTPEGTVRVTDFMPPRDEATDVVRIVEAVSGRVPMRMVLRLRFDYGAAQPWVRHRDGQLVAVAGPDAVWLRTSVGLHAVHRDLVRDGLVHRYDTDDGLPGEESAFLACSFWLADALHGIGERDEAHALFTRLLDLRNDVGLLSEEYDTGRRRQVGNTPQAFSMVGLVNTARHLSGSTISTSAPGNGRGSARRTS